MEFSEHFVILGDVVGSSKKMGVQRMLHQAVDGVNGSMPVSWITPFEITRGDEVAAVTQTALSFWKMIQSFNEKARPLRLRWSVSFGLITEGLSSGSSAEALGPAFKTADLLMLSIKRRDIYFAIDTQCKDRDIQVSGLINLLLWHLNALSDLQYLILKTYLKSRKQTETAAILGKKQQQIQSTLKAIGWESIDLAEKALIHLLKNQFNQQHASRN